MKTNAIVRIVLWSLVLVIFLGILAVWLVFSPYFRSTTRESAVVIQDLEPSSMDGTAARVIATATENLNVHKQAGSNSEAIGVVEKGDVLQIISTEMVSGTQWGKIPDFGGGWVDMTYVEVDELISGANAANGSTSPVSGRDGGACFSPDEVHRININWVSGKVTLSPADVTDITVLDETPDSKYPTVFKLRSGKLTIDFSENTTFNGFGVHFDLRKDLTIQVPRDFVLEELELDAASTDLEVHDLTIREVDIDTASGASTFIGCAVEELDVDSASGDVIFKGSLGKLEFDAASADFQGVFTNVPGELSLDSMSGKLDITLPSDAGFTAKLDGMSSDFSSEFDTTSLNGRHTHGNGACRIDADGMNCDVTIRQGENAALPFGVHYAEDAHHEETEPHHEETEPHHEVTEPHHTESDHHS